MFRGSATVGMCRNFSRQLRCSAVFIAPFCYCAVAGDVCSFVLADVRRRLFRDALPLLESSMPAAGTSLACLLALAFPYGRRVESAPGFTRPQ